MNGLQIALLDHRARQQPMRQGRQVNHFGQRAGDAQALGGHAGAGNHYRGGKLATLCTVAVIVELLDRDFRRDVGRDQRRDQPGQVEIGAIWRADAGQGRTQRAGQFFAPEHPAGPFQHDPVGA